ncbi:MAG: Asp-tRNA(Asn)/Glu-tRNA(Gln) amidotransferase subunit GatB [Parcubacteria group bacterium]|nr:Asp-tRNA(Asn)/Glu-tRNA(Gln) amidotransferase subunit GatB [Parcubacteria group bacterium]
MLEIIIGLEIHLQLKTKTKMFCSCVNESLAQPNTNVCPICIGHPGVLPVLNKKALELGLRLGSALKGKINPRAEFSRKNYFYPDLPKGYQISQYELPIIEGGLLAVRVDGQPRTIRLRRIHLEEDAAKDTHTKDTLWTLIDFNRSGAPLVEIVTMPDIRSPKEAKLFLQELRLIARYLDISDANMERGEMRCDANISLRPLGDETLYPKTEIKNLNSFKIVEDALSYEVKRQADLWNEKKPPRDQETRGYDEQKKETIRRRSKETEGDYRYFPEPDLPPLNLEKFIKENQRIVSAVELPEERRMRFMEMYSFDPYDAGVLVGDKDLADYAEKVISELKAWLVSLETVEGSEKEIWAHNKTRLVKLVANWLIHRLLALLRSDEAELLKISPENFAEFIILLYENKLNATQAQKVLEKMFQSGCDPDVAVREFDMSAKGNEKELEKEIDAVLSENHQAIEQYRLGKTNVLLFLIGQTMKKTKGRYDANTIREIIHKKLSS